MELQLGWYTKNSVFYRNYKSEFFGWTQLEASNLASIDINPSYLDLTQLNKNTELFGYKPLARIFKEKKPHKNWNLTELIELALRLTELLEPIHFLNKVHLSVNPFNIVLDSSFIPYLTNFAFVQSAQSELKSSNHFHVEHSINYIAPEQTGKLNQKFNASTDVYSLGLVLYELFTGEQAISGTDSLQIIYKHLTHIPELANTVNAKVGPLLGLILNKCLAKNQESRYQTIKELSQDIQKALALALGDNKNNFVVELESATINSSHVNSVEFYLVEPIIKKIELVLLNSTQSLKLSTYILKNNGLNASDYIIQQLENRLIKDNLFVVTTDLSLDSSQPYQSIKNIIQSIYKQLLLASEDDLFVFTSWLSSSAGESLDLLVDLVPSIQNLYPTKSFNYQSIDNQVYSTRLSYLFAAFLDAFSQLERSLILVFKNANTANSSTLKVLEGVYKEFVLTDLQLLFIEEQSNKGFQEFLTQHIANQELRTFELNPFSRNEIAKALQQIQLDESVIDQFTELLHYKTRGSFFILNRLLEELEQLNGVEKTKNQLSVNIELAESIQINESGLFEYYSQLIESLSADQLKVVQYAALIGTRFKTFAIEVPEIAESVLVIIEDLVLANIIRISSQQNNEFYFIHTEAREVVLKTVKYKQRKNLIKHLVASESIQNKSNFDKLKYAELLLSLQGEDINTYQSIILEVADSAKEIAAFDQHYNLLKLVYENLSDSDWTQNTEECLEIGSNLLIATSLFEQYEGAHKLFEFLKGKATQNAQKIQIHYAYSEALLGTQQFDKYLEIVVPFLKTQKIELSTQPGLPRIIYSMVRTGMYIDKKNEEFFNSLPVVKEQNEANILRILLSSIGACYVANPKMIPEIVYRLTALTLKYGKSENLSSGIASYAFLQSNFTENHAAGKKFIGIANKLNENPQRPSSKTTIDFLWAAFIANWHLRFSETKKELFNNYIRARQIGNVGLAFYNLTFYQLQRIYSEDELNTFKSDLNSELTVLKQLNQVATVKTTSLILNFIELLQAKPANQSIFLEQHNSMVQHFSATNDQTNISLGMLLESILSVFIKTSVSIDEKIRLAKEMQANLGKGFYSVYRLKWQIAIEISMHSKSFAQYKKFVVEVLKQYKIAAELMPVNNKAHYLLLKGLYANRISKGENFANLLKSYELFTQNNQFLSASIAAKAIATLYKEQGIDSEANVFTQRLAMQLNIYGAKGLSRLYNATQSTKSLESNQSIDIQTFIKSSNSISKELNLEKMLLNLMEVLIENAGAQNAAFLVHQNKKYNCLASKFNGELTVNQYIAHGTRFPLTILRSAFRSKEVIIETNAFSSTIFGVDPYVAEYQLKSVLCLPIVKNQQVTGLLYLENNLVEGAFTRQSIETLKLLASQIAVNFENAALYNEMEQKVKDRTKELQREKDLVEFKNKEITDSIIYAKRIQDALLPGDKVVKKSLPNSFVFYKPKDIVAGDFYWLQHVNDKVLFAVADCTGHGVPGAMVSVICNNGLNQSVRDYNKHTPAEILNETRSIVLKEFAKSEDTVDDGMDIALVGISKLAENEFNVEFAGANNPLWVIRKDSSEIEILNPDKQPIGSYTRMRDFANHSLVLNSGDMLYLFTDGYRDQFGGESHKKFKTSRLKELLLHVSSMPLEQQYNTVKQVFNSWKGDIEQIDDVCLAGIRL